MAGIRGMSEVCRRKGGPACLGAQNGFICMRMGGGEIT